MKNLQDEVGKILKEKKVSLSQETLLLGIYEELSNLTRATLAKEGLPSSNPSGDAKENLGELGALIMALCNESGIDFEDAVKAYLDSIS